MIGTRASAIKFLVDAPEATYEVREYREHRSREANSYFHVLCNKIATERTVRGDICSLAKAKNEAITKYGQLMVIGNKIATVKTNIEPEEMQEEEYLHARLFNIDEQGAYWYHVFRGSHTYNTREMSVLIDGTIEDAKDLGIETLTPDQLTKLKGYGHA